MIRNFQFSIFNFQLINETIKKKNKGQIVLILVLITVVGLTIGLSLISRTVTDIRISSQIEQSSRAFSAAESGVESALKGTAIGAPIGNITLPGATAEYEVRPLGGGSEAYTLSHTDVGRTQTVWLIDHDENGNIIESGGFYPVTSFIRICFGTVGNTKPAVSLTFIYKDGTDFKISKQAYDADTTRGNGFLPAEVVSGNCPVGYNYTKSIQPSSIDLQIPLTAVLYVLRVQPVYQSTGIAILPVGGATLPLQGKLITSVGQTGTGVVRRIQVTQGYASLPPLLDFALFTEE